MQIPTSTSDSTPSDGFASAKAYAGSVLVDWLFGLVVGKSVAGLFN